MDAHKVTVIVLAAAMVVFSITSPVVADVDFNDGGTHNIDYEINSRVNVDSGVPGMHTTVNLLPGGSIPWPHDLYGYNNSHINMSGGSIGADLWAYDSSEVIVSGGSIGRYLNTRDTSDVTISGGSIGMFLQAWDSSQVIVSGGSIGRDLRAYDNTEVTVSGGSIADDIIAGYYPTSESVITFLGTDFAIDGEAVGYGEVSSINGGWFDDDPKRRLTGVLASGDLLDNDFYIGGSSRIVLAPEPATVAFVALGLAGVVAAKRQRQSKIKAQK